MENTLFCFGLAAILAACLCIHSLYQFHVYKRRRDGKACHNCDHMVDLGEDEVMCGASLGLEPLPSERTCWGFKKKLE